MKREEKNELSRRRILEAALGEFSARGYEGASLNAFCGENGISKGVLYHYFRDKDELYLLCVEACFRRLTAYLAAAWEAMDGGTEEKLRGYFDARLRFFAEHPLDLGIFADAALSPPPALAAGVAEARRGFDRLNAAVLTELLKTAALRPGLTVDAVVEDFRGYMDYFNTRFKAALRAACSAEEALRRHEEKCHRQLDILLHGVMGGAQ